MSDILPIAASAGLQLDTTSRRWTFRGEPDAFGPGTEPLKPPRAKMSSKLQANYLAACAAKANPDKFWWFITDDSVTSIAADLREKSYCIVDGLVGSRTCEALLRGCQACLSHGLLGEAQLGGTRGSDARSFSHAAARNDLVAWFQATEGEERASGAWEPGTLVNLARRIDTLVEELKPHLPTDLGRIGNRAALHVACYPGGGARYVRHCDNTCNRGVGDMCNGRRLTAVWYPNTAWQPEYGGALRIWPPTTATAPLPMATGPHGSSEEMGTECGALCDVEPRADRLLLFFADVRVPHEVLPAYQSRYAITLWYFDTPERERAKSLTTDKDEVRRFMQVSERNHGGRAAPAAGDPNDVRM